MTATITFEHVMNVAKETLLQIDGRKLVQSVTAGIAAVERHIKLTELHGDHFDWLHPPWLDCARVLLAKEKATSCEALIFPHCKNYEGNPVRLKNLVRVQHDNLKKGILRVPLFEKVHPLVRAAMDDAIGLHFASTT